jgi:hypothetical protein
MPEHRAAYSPYLPLSRLKPVTANVWVADGEEIRFGAFGLTLPFPTRMTVIRLKSGGLFVHSPIALAPELTETLDALGPVVFIVAPNTIHYWWVPEWKARYPNAVVYAAPGLDKSAKRTVPIDAVLGDAPPDAWAEEIDQVLFRGDVMNEVCFFHRVSGTAILTDLIENFEPKRFRNILYRWLVRLAHAADPDGTAPYDMRATFRRHRAAMRAGVARMIAWQPERVILAHGRWYDRNGTEELRRAFRWV